MKNNLYKETFEQIKLSEECLRKVKNMEVNEKKEKKFRVRFAAVAVVVLGIFACGNIITYAATGNNLVKQISVSIDGEKKTEELITNPDGSYEYDYTGKDGAEYEFRVEPGKTEEEFDFDYNINTKKDEVEMIIKEKETEVEKQIKQKPTEKHDFQPEETEKDK